MIKLKNKMPTFAVFLVTLFSTLGFVMHFSAPQVSAASPPFGCPGGPIGPGAPSSCPYTEEQIRNFCANPSTIPEGYSVFCDTNTGTVEVSRISNIPAGADLKGDCKPKAPETNLTAKNCAIVAYLITIVNILSGLVGIVVVIMIAIGGLQYAASRDNPQATVNAKNRLKTAVLALIGYLFIFAFLQYIIPGGIL